MDFDIVSFGNESLVLVVCSFGSNVLNCSLIVTMDLVVVIITKPNAVAKIRQTPFLFHTVHNALVTL